MFKGLRHPHLLAPRVEPNTTTLCQPVRGAAEAVGRPHLAPVKLGHEAQKAVLGSRDVGREGRYLVLQRAIGEFAGGANIRSCPEGGEFS